MAPIKRSRRDAQVEDGEDDVEVLEQASSNLRGGNPSKRQRVSEVYNDADDSEPDVLVHDNGRGQYTSTQLQRLGNHKSDYERLRDQTADGSSGDEARLERRATQSVRKQRERQTLNQAAEAGVIEEVLCTNFMCHKNLRVTLGPLINFIIGHNGSGKSAVLTAITLCLGGKATSTNRGQSLKSFVKEGEENATLSVKIKNQGDTSFKHDLYGNSILVERHFSIHGTSGFKIKNAEGRIVSTKRSELDDITDFYALQLDNPVNVLTQDMARQFLHNSTPTDKYKFFIKGVQLEQLDNDYTVLADELDLTDAQLVNAKENVDVLQDKAKRAQEKLRLSEKNNTLRDKIRKYSRQMAWVQVQEQEMELERIERKTQEAEELITQRTNAAASYEEGYAAADQALETAKQMRSDFEKELEPLSGKAKEAKKQYDDNEAVLLNVTSEQRELQGSLTGAKKRAKKVQDDISVERKRLEAADGGSHANKMLEIDEARGQVQEAQQRRDDHQMQLPQLLQVESDAKQRAKDARPQLDKKKEDVEQAAARLRSLQQDQGEQSAAYNPNLRNLLRAIESETGFREKPLGPAGHHVRLLKPEWSSIMEKAFGATLNSFIVTTKADQSLLSDIMRRVKCPYPIIIGRRQPLDTAPHEPDAQFLTMLRAIEVDSDLVRNQLIINHHIEKTVLIQDRGEAYRFTFGQGAAPRNVSAVFCFHPSKRGWGIRFSHAPGGNQKSDPAEPWHGRPRMRTDIEAQIQMQQDTIRGLKQELDDCSKHVRDLDTQVQRASQAARRHANESKELSAAVDEAESRLDTLKDELEEETAGEAKLEGLNGILQRQEEEVERYQSEFDNAVAQRDELDQKKRELEEQLKTCKNEEREVEVKIGKADKAIAKREDRRETALRHKNEAFQQIDDAKRAKATLERERQEQASVVETYTREASEYCARVPVDERATMAGIEKHLEKLKADLARCERELGGNREQIARAALDTSEKWNHARKHLDNLTSLSETLIHSLHDRQKRWRRFRTEISVRARIMFFYLLSERGFRGEMTVHHGRKELDLTVEPDPTRRSGEGRQAKTLSGGEKSFSTICLLLSLWDAMGSPIRCLDEFDVFMDSVNRKKALEMIIGAARRSVGRQYIFITPQSMENVTMHSDVRVIRLSDPERGQTTLNFAAAA